MEQEQIYAAYKDCGCMAAVAIIPVDPKARKEMSKEVARWVNAGYRIAQIEMVDVQSSIWECDECAPPRKQREMFPKE